MDFWVYVTAAFSSRKNPQTRGLKLLAESYFWQNSWQNFIFLSTRNLALNEELNDP